MSPSPRSRPLYALAMVMVIAGGLLWRSRFLSLPSFAAKYGGDALWVILVFLGFAFVFNRASTLRIAALALAFSWIVEFSQLYHAPWIDSVRATRLGALAIGSTFNWPDLPAYALGIALAMSAEKLFLYFTLKTQDVQ